MNFQVNQENRIAYCLFPVLVFLAGREILNGVCTSVLLHVTDMTAESVRYIGSIVSAIGILPVMQHFFYRPMPPKQKEVIAKTVLSVICLCIAGAGACILFNLLFYWTGLTKLFANDYSDTVMMLYGGDILLQIVWMVIAAPVSEELAFRGILFQRVREGSGFWAAVVVSSLLFGITHGYILQSMYSMLIGLLLCVIYERGGRLWQCVVFHMAANACSVLFTFWKMM